MLNLSAFVKWHALRTPDRLALVYEQERVGFSELNDRILRMAAFLHKKGIGKDDVVAAFMKNSAAFLEIAFATSHLSAIFLPINYRLARDEAEYILGDAHAKVLFADDEYAALLSNIPGVETVIVDDAAQHDGRKLAGTTLPIPPTVARKGSDLFRLMYTSGTTDRPKGVMHTYDNFYWKSISHVISLNLTAVDRLLVVGPLYHVGAFDLPGLATLWVGGMMYVVRNFEPSAVLAAIEKERLTCAWLAPVMLGRILAVEDRDRYDVTSLKWAIGGGEKTPESRIHGFREYFTKGRYIDGYGLTETCSGDTLMEPEMEIRKIGSPGRALLHCEVEIRDDEGRSLPANAVGEICVRGPKVTGGYWNNPEKNAASFFGEWLRTGDVGYLDEDGFLYLTDRKKDMIITGGENVASSEVERVIYQLPEVSEVCVIGVPDEKWGELVTAVVVPKEGKTVTQAMIEKHCRQFLGGFKVPRKLILRDMLPRNPSGKILKRVLREEHRAG
jgi:acyl-CoA synthetase (AMP-forming)/AMP-acid ligase II